MRKEEKMKNKQLEITCRLAWRGGDTGPSAPARSGPESHKPQPTPDRKKKRKGTKINVCKINKCTRIMLFIAF